MNDIFHGCAYNVLCATKRATAFRNCPRNCVEVSEGKARRQILPRSFYNSMHSPFRNTFATFKCVIWHVFVPQCSFSITEQRYLPVHLSVLEWHYRSGR